MLKEFKTVLNPAIAEFEEKKSRFIANVKPVTTEEEAISFIHELKTKHWDASHNVYSYFIGGNNIIQRFSDDGEPTGTAGLPVLEVIKRSGLQDLVIVITRYFGGTLLGAAGLIRAYSKSAALGIESAAIIKKQLCTQASVIIEYTLLGKIQSLLISQGFTISDVSYERDVEIKLFIPVDDIERFIKLINESSNARAIMDFGGDCFIKFSEDGKLI